MNKEPLSSDSFVNTNARSAPLLMSRQMLYDILMHTPALVCVLRGPDFVFELINESCRNFLEGHDADGKKLFDVLPELEDQGFLKIIRSVYCSGQSYSGNEMPVTLNYPEGKRTFFINFSFGVLEEEGDDTKRILIFAYDVTAQVMIQRKMQQAADMVEQLYMNAPAFISTLKGPDHVYELVNPQYQKLYGRRQLLGKKIIEALPEIKGQGIIEKLDKVYQTGEPWVATEMLLYLSRDEGREPEPTYLNFSYQPMYTSEKEINGILVFGYEVTQQVMARKKNEEQLRMILESLPQITSASSADGTNIFFNKFFFDYSGLSRDEASVNGWNSILHPNEVESVLAQWEKCRNTGEDFYRMLRLKRKSDESYRWHLAHLTALKDEKGGITQWIGSATDIHEQKIKEQKKDEFLSIASHEMKTPLTTAKAYLQLLELSLDKNNEKAGIYTRKAILSVERLKDLISELLDVNKIQHGKLNFNLYDFDFNKMIEEAVESVQYNSPYHTIVKTGHIAVPVQGDKERLQQVIINFLSNAVKYSPDADTVYIDVMLNDGQIKVSVKDRGIGIARENIKRIFERYFRVEGQDIHFQGLGIGLFISMEIIKRHNGEIWAESTPGEGSTFYFTIPAINPAENN